VIPANEDLVHPWDVTEDQARQIQVRIASLVVSHDDWNALRFVGGVSVRPLDESMVRAAVSILDLETMSLVDSSTATANVHTPYISGLRTFQAGPAISAAFEKLGTAPDLILWDGHGIAHPRHCGLASHMGLLLNIPSIGVCEQLLYGECNLKALTSERGAHVPVLDPENNMEIGAAVRTRRDIRPIYVSVGHRVSLKSAIRIVLECSPSYRFPEPLRQAGILSKR
jgi:deoxyribonuclease V